MKFWGRFLVIRQGVILHALIPSEEAEKERDSTLAEATRGTDVTKKMLTEKVVIEKHKI